jgi:hypothetical protein
MLKTILQPNQNNIFCKILDVEAETDQIIVGTAHPVTLNFVQDSLPKTITFPANGGQDVIVSYLQLNSYQTLTPDLVLVPVQAGVILTPQKQLLASRVGTNTHVALTFQVENLVIDAHNQATFNFSIPGLSGSGNPVICTCSIYQLLATPVSPPIYAEITAVLNATVPESITFSMQFSTVLVASTEYTISCVFDFVGSF